MSRTAADRVPAIENTLLPVKLHRIEAICGMTGLCRSMIRNLIKAGKLKTTKINGARLIFDSSLRELVKSGEGE
jgi:hypothetical protein